MMKTASWATLAALMWSGAAYAAGEENLDVEVTTINVDFEGRAVLYSAATSVTAVMNQYVSQSGAEARVSSHDYDEVQTFPDGSKAGWRGCTGTAMCLESGLTDSAGSAATGAEMPATGAPRYLDGARNGPGGMTLRGLISDDQQLVTAYVRECSTYDASRACTAFGALQPGSRIIYVNHTDTGAAATGGNTYSAARNESEPHFVFDKALNIVDTSGATGRAQAAALMACDFDAGGGACSTDFNDTDGKLVTFEDMAGVTTESVGSGASAPTDGNAAVMGGLDPSDAGNTQRILYVFENSGEFQLFYDLVVETSVKHQDDGRDKVYEFYTTIWGHDNDDTGGAM